MILPQDVIRQKRNGNELSNDQIQCFVDGLVNKDFSDAQVAALAMAIFFNGMNANERVDLTTAMMNSGSVLSWRGFIDGPIVDKHSTGGVGDKVSLMLAPIVAACGAYVPMVSGRGLGHTGGTTDKLESIPGFITEPSVDDFKRIVKQEGTAIITQTPDIAPADKRLYAIRDVTATVESIGLITASILSKKLASGLDALVMDVKVGNGAMMDNLSDALALARSIVTVANGAGCQTTALVTDMNEVLGDSAGNSLEVIETLRFLDGSYQEPRLLEVTLALAAQMLVSAKIAKTIEIGHALAKTALDTGKAAEVFAKMVAAQGGSNELFEKSETLLDVAPNSCDITAPIDGVITAMDTRAIGMQVVQLGGGRTNHTQKIDHGVGFNQILPVGTKVSKGQPIAKVYTRDGSQLAEAITGYQSNITIGDQVLEPKPLIYKVVD